LFGRLEGRGRKGFGGERNIGEIEKSFTFFERVFFFKE